MSATFTWAVTEMMTVQQPDPDYVVHAMWTLTGEEGGFTASYVGDTKFDSQQSTPFIPYDQLTEAIVVGWIQASLGTEGVAQFEGIIQNNLNSQLNPAPVPEPTPLPWYVPPAPPAA
jgi:hypothetical protein